MSRFLKNSSNKRSSSYCDHSSRGLIRAIPCRESPNQSQNMSPEVEDILYNFNKQTILTDLSCTEFIPSKLRKNEKEIQMSSEAEIDRLVTLNSELRKENRALTNKLIENSNFQLRVCQLESHNKQLQKELSRKDEILKGGIQEASPVKKTVTSSYDEILAQNEILTDEVRWLKGQLDGMIHEKSTIEVKSYAHQKLEAKLEEANSQIELLKQELIKKNYEVEELYDRTQRSETEPDLLSANYYRSDNSRNDECRNIEVSKLREKIFGLQSSLEKANQRSCIAENELKCVKTTLSERNLEFNNLRTSFDHIDKEKEEELRLKERQIEQMIKSKTNDSIKQMLQEKLQYEQKIAFLEESLESLKIENTKLKANAEEWYETKFRRENRFSNQKQVQTERLLRDCEEDKVKVVSLLNGQEKETIKMLQELKDLSNEIVLYQERMKNLEKLYKLEKENFQKGEHKKAELIEELKRLKDHIERQELKFGEERSGYEKNLERFNCERREWNKQKDELNEVKNQVKENEILIAKALHYREKFEGAELKSNYLLKEVEKFKSLYEAAKKIDSERLYDRDAEISKRECNSFKENDLNLREVILKFNAEKRKYESEIQQLQTLKESAEDQVEKLYDLLHQRKQECEAYLDENERLWSETERLRNYLHNNSEILCNSALMETGLQRERCHLEIERLNKGLEEANIELSLKIDGNEY